MIDENEVTEVAENEQAQIQAELERQEQKRLEQERLELERQQEIERQEAEEKAREQARIEHENFLNSFPDTTVFYQELKEEGDVKWLCGTVKDAHTAESYGWLDNHYDESELTYIGSPECGTYYLKGHKKPAETPEEFIARRESEIVNMVQNIIDETAQQKRYDDGLSCATYYGDPDEEFNADAVAFVAWRGRCWRTCYNILDSVIAGTIAPEDVTDEYVRERLPIMEWPTVEE